MKIMSEAKEIEKTEKSENNNKKKEMKDIDVGKFL